MSGNEVLPHGDHHDAWLDKLEPIAVIGFSGRFPQDAASPEAFWRLLCEGRSTMTKVPEDRFNVDSFYHPNVERLDTLNAKGGHFLQGDITTFDAPFFSIPRAEAVSMDPQQRGLLESVYHALENAGISLEHAAGSKTGVYVGCFTREYDAICLRDPEDASKYMSTGTSLAMLSNRLSWFYDFTGPSVAIDTACSSSLNALHLACQSVRNRESSMAIVAGCNLIFSPDTIAIPLSNLNFLSPDSRCYSFDHRANGYSRGEGFGVVAIKLLSEALQDSNTIRAVIRATGSNQDGRTPGITQPSKHAQEVLIRETYSAGGLDLTSTRFVEAHGTGTPAGDPIEASAISAAFQHQRSQTDPLLIGAVKSNIGHLEGGSGMAGLIKTIQVLERGLIPPNVGFEKPNPAIHAEKWNIKFPSEVTPWPTQGLRRASVNSFGYGGANAHVVLDDAYNYMSLRGLSGRHCTVKQPPLGGSDMGALITEVSGLLTDVAHEINQALSTNSPQLKNGSYQTNGLQHDSPGLEYSSARPRVFVWSSSDEAGIKRLATVFHDHLTRSSLPPNTDPDTYFNDLAYTLAIKRSRLPWKSYVISESLADLPNQLLKNLSKPTRSSNAAPKLNFVFTGQGAQWYAMGRELLAYPVFESSLRRASQHLRALGCQWSLMEELLRDEDQTKVNNAEFSQPLCTVLQVALVDLLASWNIRPEAVVGHSSGEIAAAYCIGALSREAAWKISYFRGSLSARLAMETREQPGSMISVALSETELLPIIEQLSSQGRIAVGCVNSPKNTTMTGDKNVVDDLKDTMDRRQIFARKLAVDVAYHSTQMNEIAAEYRMLIEDIDSATSNPPACDSPKMYSSVTGQLVSAAQLSKSEYWISNMVSKVLFSKALSLMCQPADPKEKPNIRSMSGGINYVVEIGPHSALQRPIKDTVSSELDYSSVLRKDTSALQTAISLAGKLHCRGCIVDLMKVNFPTQAQSSLNMLTALPEYPFNYSQSYWHESRVSKNFRFRQHPRHELLGTPSADWNNLEAKWRYIIRRSENPWVDGHKFKENEIYPGAGMIVMAIEAARQVAGSPMKIKGYRFKDVTFTKALILPPDADTVETEFYLRPLKHDTTLSEWNNFRLCMFSNNQWVEISQGTVIAEYEEIVSDVDNGHEIEQTRQHYVDAFRSGVNACRHAIDSKQLYENLASLGYSFGPPFQNLTDVIYGDEGEVTATLKLREWMKKVPNATNRIQPHVIHPTSLDSVFHLPLAALAKGGRKPISTMFPTIVEDMWISNDLLTQCNLQEAKAFSKSSWDGYRETHSNTVVLNAVNEEPLIIIDRMRAIAMGSLDVYGWRRLCFNIDWKPDLDILDQEQLSAYCENAVKTRKADVDDLIDQSELACLYFIFNALETVSDHQLLSLSTTAQRYITWSNYSCNQKDRQLLLSSPEMLKMRHDEQYRETFLNDLANKGPEGNLTVTVGRNLSSILRGETDALDILFRGNLIQDFYNGVVFGVNYSKLAAYVDLLAHKNPSLSILEIGAGTGGATEPVLRALGPKNQGHEHSTPRYDQYAYTDISPGFFEDARTRFRTHTDRLVFKILDIEKDPLLQGFEASKYDLIIASCVLHATANINCTLSNTRKLLKPGGKLLLLEPCNLHSLRIPFVFGLLPGWWLGTEKYREWGPLLSEGSWREVLSRNHFSGIDISLSDFDRERHTFNVIATTALKLAEPASPFTLKTVIVAAEDSKLQNQVAQDLKTRLQLPEVPSCCIRTPHDLCDRDLDNTLCIFLPDLTDSFLNNISSENFASLKRMVKYASGILWVSHKATENPEMGIVTGFGRSTRSENSKFRFIELALERVWPTMKMVDSIVKVCRVALSEPHEQNESEYLERQDLLCINRLVEANVVNDAIFSRLSQQEPELCRFGQEPERALSLSIASPGLLDTLHFGDDNNAQRPLEAQEVEVIVASVGLNFKDVLIALGQLPGKHLGSECAGTVRRVGERVDSTRLKPGDRVCCITSGTFKTYARSDESSAIKIPDNMPFSTAASFPVVFCTSHYALHHLARLRKGESILIHSAAGGVGQAAIQLAQLTGADIYVTVGTNEKKRLLMKTYNLREDHIFSSRNMSFARGVKRMTNNRGVDIVLNSLSGEGLRRSFECIAPLGRFIEIGKKDMVLRANLPMAPFLDNVTFASVDLSVVADQARPLMAELMETMISLATTQPGRIHPPEPLHIYRVSQIEEAFRFLQSGKNAGKAVIEFHREDAVPTVPSTKPAWHFDANSTYVLCGAFGGLGRNIVRWMMSRGARHLLLLSRSGPQGDDALTLLEELKTKGVDAVSPPCDISDESALKDVLARYGKILPPIKGCIQGSMVLKDGLFENMTVTDFQAVLQPKVQGSWNLHVHLPKAMDFFILLSSTGGVIGNRGQSNYSAANTYQDALARHRVSKGEKCVSLNLGLMLEVGFAAERQNLMDRLRGAGHEGISQAEFLAMLDYFCNPALALLPPSRAQIVTGAGISAAQKAKRLAETFWMSRPLFRGLKQMDKMNLSLDDISKATTDYAAMLRSADSQAAAEAIIAQAVARKLSIALCMPEEDVEVDKPPHAYGVDSLVAVELRHWLAREFNAEVPIFDILGSESIFNLGVLVAEKSIDLQGLSNLKDVGQTSDEFST